MSDIAEEEPFKTILAWRLKTRQEGGDARFITKTELTRLGVEPWSGTLFGIQVTESPLVLPEPVGKGRRLVDRCGCPVYQRAPGDYVTEHILGVCRVEPSPLLDD